MANTLTPLVLATVLTPAPPATAQDPPAPTPPQLTCADWGTYRFFEMALPDTITACLSAGADPGVPVDSYRGTPLHHAARANPNPAVVAVLLANGADVNASDLRGTTPLHVAALRNPNRDIIEVLVGLGADIELPGRDGSTALRRAGEGVGGFCPAALGAAKMSPPVGRM